MCVISERIVKNIIENLTRIFCASYTRYKAFQKIDHGFNNNNNNNNGIEYILKSVPMRNSWEKNSELY